MLDLIDISQKLKEDFKSYYSLMISYFNLFKGITPLVEDIEDTQKVALEILTDLRLCRERIEKDCIHFKKILIEENPIDEFVLEEFNDNLLDLSQTCEQLIERYERFEYRDNKQLQKELQDFINDLKNLDNVIDQYNSKYLQNVIIPSLQFDKLNKVVNLGFNITTPLQKVSFDTYFKDKKINKNFKNWLLQNNQLDKKKYEREWRQLYYKYLNRKGEK